MAVGHLNQHLVVDEEVAELVGVDVVSDQLVKELEDEDAALVDLLPILLLNFGIELAQASALLTLQLLIFHLKVLIVGATATAISDCLVSQEVHEVAHYMEQDDLLEIFLHLRRFLRREIFEELADADFDPLLTRVDHVVRQVSQEDVPVFLLVLRAEEVPDRRRVDVVQQHQ